MARSRTGGDGAGSARRRATMTDVARLAECSQSTVSVVLNNTSGIKISAATRERVIEAARQLNYDLPHSTATPAEWVPQIAVIFDRIATRAEALIAIDGIREGAWATGHVVSVCETLNNTEMEDRALRALVQGETDLVIYASTTTRKVTLPQRLLEMTKPVILLNCYTGGPELPSVVPGEVAGGHRATDALIEAGHSRIAIITGDLRTDAAEDRLKGYRQALATADIPFDPTLVREGDWRIRAGYEHTKALMEMPRPPTAIFCSNDHMAAGCYDALKEQGLAIPDDVSVIGYGDEDVARHISPPLSTLSLPYREMGRWAIERGLAMASETQPKFRVTKLECTLIERKSIAAPKSQAIMAHGSAGMRKSG